MFTTDEIRAIPILSAIPVADLERLAKSAADIQLTAGEWAVQEGDERAFYAVISGKIEVIKLFDGVPRTLGWRLPEKSRNATKARLAASAEMTYQRFDCCWGIGMVFRIRFREVSDKFRSSSEGRSLRSM